MTEYWITTDPWHLLCICPSVTIMLNFAGRQCLYLEHPDLTCWRLNKMADILQTTFCKCVASSALNELTVGWVSYMNFVMSYVTIDIFSFVSTSYTNMCHSLQIDTASSVLKHAVLNSRRIWHHTTGQRLCLRPKAQAPFRPVSPWWCNGLCAGLDDWTWTCHVGLPGEPPCTPVSMIRTA